MIWLIGKSANEPPSNPALTLTQLIERGAFRDGPSRKRLESFGIDFSKCRSVNLCSPGTWDFYTALMHWRQLAERHMTPGDTALLFGGDVCRAVGVPYSALFTAFLKGFRLVACPHPSGLNHWWNEAENCRRFRECIRSL